MRIENITRPVGSTTTCDRRPDAGRVVPAASTVTVDRTLRTSSRVIAKLGLPERVGRSSPDASIARLARLSLTGQHDATGSATPCRAAHQRETNTKLVR